MLYAAFVIGDKYIFSYVSTSKMVKRLPLFLQAALLSVSGLLLDKPVPANCVWVHLINIQDFAVKPVKIVATPKS